MDLKSHYIYRWSGRRRPARLVFGEPAAWSTDGLRIALMRPRNRPALSDQLVVMSASGTDIHRVPGVQAEAELELSWSPTGEIVLNTLRGIAAVKPDGTGFRVLAKVGGNPSWSPDGRWIVFDSVYDGLFEVRPNGSDLHRLVRARPPSNLTAFTWPSWSPDGKQIAFFERAELPLPEGHVTIHVVNATGGNDRIVARPRSSDSARTGLTWSADGRWLAFADASSPDAPNLSGIWAVSTTGGKPVRLFSGPFAFPSWGPASP